MLLSSVPAIRIRECNREPIRASGNYVLYWMVAARRLSWNFALDRVLEQCRQLKKPPLIFEALRCDYFWASDRLHRFVLDGMAANIREAARHRVAYYLYVEPSPGAAQGLLEALAAEACVVVTDDFPAFFLTDMLAAAGKKLPVRLEAIDSNGLLPLRAANEVYGRAVDFRRFLQKSLPAHLLDFPSSAPLGNKVLPTAAIPKSIATKWQPATRVLLGGDSKAIAALPIDHTVAPVELPGGSVQARQCLRDFLDRKLAFYNEARNEPELDGSSGFSPYLHFGHLSVHEIFTGLAARERWKPEKLQLRATGKREGWWNLSAAAESFLDELVTWRELGFNFSSQRSDYDEFSSLPDWARHTLKKHSADKRKYLYTLEQFESAQTHDPLWNAAQTQIVREGRMHNYLRMLWGKKILEWSRSPQQALSIMIHLNNKYGLDGRDPNSYTGIFWVLGRYDHPWPPERPIFGTVRYMSSENTARKFSVKNYIAKYSGAGQASLPFRSAPRA